MIKAIFVIGKPGGGKTELTRYLSKLLTERGVGVCCISDRLWLEEAVLQDISNGGLHGKLIADGPPGQRKIHVLDGMLLNQVHREMMGFVAKHQSRGNIILAEYAIGPNIDFGQGKTPLLQSAWHLVERAKRFRVLDNLLIVDTEASLGVRAERQSRRVDAMDPATFQAYFPDGGEVTSEIVAMLNGRYYFFNNNQNDLKVFHEGARRLLESFIWPGLQVEGNPGRIERET